ncbi:hypothetical protein [Nocardioides sp. KR10-350]
MRLMVMLTEPDHYDRWESVSPAGREELARLLPDDLTVEIRPTVEE